MFPNQGFFKTEVKLMSLILGKRMKVPNTSLRSSGLWCSGDGGCEVFLNIGILLQDYAVSQPRRPPIFTAMKTLNRPNATYDNIFDIVLSNKQRNILLMYFTNDRTVPLITYLLIMVTVLSADPRMLLWSNEINPRTKDTISSHSWHL